MPPAAPFAAACCSNPPPAISIRCALLIAAATVSTRQIYRANVPACGMNPVAIRPPLKRPMPLAAGFIRQTEVSALQAWYYMQRHHNLRKEIYGVHTIETGVA